MLDAFEINKIVGAILSTILLTLGLSIVAEVLFETHAPEKPGYAIAVQEEQAAPAGAGEAEKTVPLAQLLAQASAERGAQVAKKCASCHTFEEGGANKIGPNLHGILGRKAASHAGFGYSAALKEMGGEWDYEKLDQFVSAPKKMVPGTAMSFAGLRKGGERADLLLYLKSISPNAPALPTQ